MGIFFKIIKNKELKIIGVSIWWGHNIVVTVDENRNPKDEVRYPTSKLSNAINISFYDHKMKERWNQLIL